jgi:hypothetical protein
MNLKSRKVYILLATIVIWFALCLQFNISLKLLNGDVINTLKVFLSYFTVITNIICAVCLTTLLFFENSRSGIFFAKASTLTAITVYIVVVGLIYNVVLRGLIHPVGWERVADELLHVVNPIIFLGFWIFYLNKSQLNYKNTFSWLIYPLLYVVFIIIRGYLIDKYPYPFINVAELGYPKALLNTLIILIVFLVLFVLFSLIGKKISGNPKEYTHHL